MASNYDPKVNRYRSFRFNGPYPDYESMRLDKPQNVLDKDEYCELMGQVVNARLDELTILSLGMASQYLVKYLKGFRTLGGYSRTAVRFGIALLPFYLMNEKNSSKLNNKYEELLTNKLKQNYENPISHQLKF